MKKIPVHFRSKFSLRGGGVQPCGNVTWYDPYCENIWQMYSGNAPESECLELQLVRIQTQFVNITNNFVAYGFYSWKKKDTMLRELAEKSTNTCNRLDSSPLSRDLLIKEMITED